MKYTEIDNETLLRAIKEATSPELFIEQYGDALHTESLTELLEYLLSQTGMSKAELARRSATSEVYLHQVFSGRRSPSRDRLLCFCLGLRCALTNAQELLRRCGYAMLYVRDRRDALLLFCLLHQKTVFEANELLEKFDLQQLLR